MSEHQKILTRSPETYPRQGLAHCNVYVVKVVMDVLGVGRYEDPRDYHISTLPRLTGMSNHRYPVKVLRYHGLQADLKSADQMDKQERLELLKRALDQDNPIILPVSKGMLRGKYYPLKAKFMGHFVVLLGYDDVEELFYIYDPSKNATPSLPIGNSTLSYTDLARDWKSTVGSAKHEYIEVAGSVDLRYNHES